MSLSISGSGSQPSVYQRSVGAFPGVVHHADLCPCAATLQRDVADKMNEILNPKPAAASVAKAIIGKVT
jgi:hypothetical protein